ncbi:MAG: porphobilinogen synthase, partial [Helicobacteraceae bacterium]|nr:porphobilinogen synthase [Helicobacteraceae bacterium]
MFKRFRRTRFHPSMRALVAQSAIAKGDLIYPLFARGGTNERNEVASMPDVFQLSIDELVKEASAAYDDGIRAVLLFGIPETKDSVGSAALDENGIIAKTLKALKSALPQMLAITDLCFCEYTDHGHCGVIDPRTNSVANDATLELLAKQALLHAKSGADMIAPSGMMDGAIAHLREALDKAGF